LEAKQSGRRGQRRKMTSTPRSKQSTHQPTNQPTKTPASHPTVISLLYLEIVRTLGVELEPKVLLIKSQLEAEVLGRQPRRLHQPRVHPPCGGPVAFFWGGGGGGGEWRGCTGISINIAALKLSKRNASLVHTHVVPPAQGSSDPHMSIHRGNAPLHIPMLHPFKRTHPAAPPRWRSPADPVRG
jgi:hypothetical protein